jgi:hypothetical protein
MRESQRVAGALLTGPEKGANFMFDRTKTARGVVIQSYSTEEAAVDAVRYLRDAGFTADDISVIAQDRGTAETVADDAGVNVAEGAGVGAVTGGALGALGGLLIGASAVILPGIGIVIAGPIAAALAGAGAGALTGGLAGALIGLGVSEDEANLYQDRFHSGDVLVTVVAGDREPEARRILGRDQDPSFGVPLDERPSTTD